MRVLCWLKTYWPTTGGVELLVARLIPALQAYGHQFIVVTEKHDPRLPDVEIHDGVWIHRFPFYPVLKAKAPHLFADTQGKLNRLTQDYQPDLFHLFTC